jgi:hypothetical protein
MYYLKFKNGFIRNRSIKSIFRILIKKLDFNRLNIIDIKKFIFKSSCKFSTYFEEKLMHLK